MPAPQPIPPVTAPDRGSRWAMALFFIQALLLAVTLAQGWDHWILDRHEYRQAQTALTIQWFVRDGFSFAYPLPLFGPPWSAPMEFPVYQALVATVMKLTGAGLEPSARAVGVAAWAAALPAIAWLLRLWQWPRATRWLALALVLTPPVYLFYVRTVMIETTALCCALWYFAAQAAALRQDRWQWLVLASVTGVLAALAKATTFAAFALPAAFLLGHQAWTDWSNGTAFPAVVRRRVLAAVPLALALAAALVWIAWSDRVKRENPLTHFLLSENLSAWNYGPLALRFEARFWRELWHWWSEGVIAPVGLALVALLAPFARGFFRRHAIGFAAAALAAALTFANLYLVHDYYACSNGVLFLLAAAAVFGAAWQNPAVPRPTCLAATVLFFGSQWSNYLDIYHPALREPAPNSAPAFARVLHGALPPDAVFVAHGADWGADLAYFSERRAIMIRTGEEDKLPAILARLPASQRPAALVVQGAQRADQAFLRTELARLRLSPLPFAEDATRSLYLAPDLLAPATANLRGYHAPDLSLNFPAAIDPAARQLAPQPFESVRRVAGIPLPHAVRGIAPPQYIEADGRPGWYLHAPAELVFENVSARNVSLEIGVLPSAYALPEGVDDGLEVLLLERRADGLQRIVFRQALDPRRQPLQRGLQNLFCELPAGFSGDLVLRISPGAADNNNRDWSYLTHLEWH